MLPSKNGNLREGPRPGPGPGAGPRRARPGQRKPPTHTLSEDHIASFVQHVREATSESQRGKCLTMAAIVRNLCRMLAPGSACDPREGHFVLVEWV